MTTRQHSHYYVHITTNSVRQRGQKVQDAGQKVQDAGQKVQDTGQKVQDAGQKVQDAGQKVQESLPKLDRPSLSFGRGADSAESAGFLKVADSPKTTSPRTPIRGRAPSTPPKPT